MAFPQKLFSPGSRLSSSRRSVRADPDIPEIGIKKVHFENNGKET
jgi:hypothetical protein